MNNKERLKQLKLKVESLDVFEFDEAICKGNVLSTLDLMEIIIDKIDNKLVDSMINSIVSNIDGLKNMIEKKNDLLGRATEEARRIRFNLLHDLFEACSESKDMGSLISNMLGDDSPFSKN